MPRASWKDRPLCFRRLGELVESLAAPRASPAWGLTAVQDPHAKHVANKAHELGGDPGFWFCEDMPVNRNVPVGASRTQPGKGIQSHNTIDQRCQGIRCLCQCRIVCSLDLKHFFLQCAARQHLKTCPNSNNLHRFEMLPFAFKSAKQCGHFWQWLSWGCLHEKQPRTKLQKLVVPSMATKRTSMTGKLSGE